MKIYNSQECGKRIRELRINAGYTQEQVASKVGADRRHLSNIENGRTNGSPEVYVELSKLYNVSVDYLFCGIDIDFRMTKKKMNELIVDLIRQEEKL